MTIAKISIMKFFLLNKLNPVLKLGYGLLISPAGDLGGHPLGAPGTFNF